MTTLDRQQDTLPTAEERFERIPIEQIVASSTNPRTHFNPAYIEDLAHSIGEKGVVQPIVVRQVAGTKSQPTRFEIVAGECRWRGAAQALQKTMPAIIRSYTDEQVLEIQLIENIHRKDLTPLEQAVGYRRLIDTNPDKHSAATIATRIGKSLDWVWDRLKLNDLIDEAKALLEQERIGVGHAILIARQKPEDQKVIIKPELSQYGGRASGLWIRSHVELEFAKASDQERSKYDGFKPVSVRELESWINDHIRFDVAHAVKAQPFEFEQTAAVIETAAAAPGRTKRLIAITHDHRVNDDAKDEAERTYGVQSWIRADGEKKSKTCEHSVLGVVVAGAGKGETLQVCINRDKCLVHFGDVIRRREKNQKLRDSGKGTQADKREKRQEESWEAKRRREQEAQGALLQAWKAIATHVIADAVAQVKAVKTLTPKRAEALLQEEYVLNRAMLKAHLGAKWYQTPVAALLVSIVGAWEYNGWNTTKSGFKTYVDEIAKPYGLNIKRLEAVRDKHAPAPAAEKNGKKKSKAA